MGGEGIFNLEIKRVIKNSSNDGFRANLLVFLPRIKSTIL